MIITHKIGMLTQRSKGWVGYRYHRFLNVKALLCAFNQEKTVGGAFSMIVKLESSPRFVLSPNPWQATADRQFPNEPHGDSEFADAAPGAGLLGHHQNRRQGIIIISF